MLLLFGVTSFVIYLYLHITDHPSIAKMASGISRSGREFSKCPVFHALFNCHTFKSPGYLFYFYVPFKVLSEIFPIDFLYFYHKRLRIFSLFRSAGNYIKFETTVSGFISVMSFD